MKVNKKDQSEHGKEILEQELGEIIELISPLIGKTSKKTKFAMFLLSVLGWATMLTVGLGLYRLIEWLITM